MQGIVTWAKEWGFAWGILIFSAIALLVYITPDFIKRRIDK